MQMIKAVFSTIAVILLWLAAGSMVRDQGFSIFTPEKPSGENEENVIEMILPLLTEQLNENAPYMIDPTLRFDEAVSDHEALNITYLNTFINLTSDDTDFVFVDEHLPDAIDYLCNEEDIRKLMSFGVSYTYVYRGRDGEIVRKFIFSEHNCNLL